MIAIDPAARIEDCAVAAGDDPEDNGAFSLTWVGFFGQIAIESPRTRLVIVERPEYQGARSDASRIQDLLALSWSGARAAYALGVSVREVTPREWKGSVPKPSHHYRIWHRILTDQEKALFPPGAEKRIQAACEKMVKKPGQPGASYYGRGRGSEVHNLLDAAGLFLFGVGRMGL